ncbi:peptide/nickel transport system ATP-binding protein/oligopeptide transport system ATP-binding protein [Roseovarius pacificus]|uniref:Peptide/nickel transport system ATP-binding protein/oligopeptide transport system ATP-binding protein n=1 Tax=Roseovarius pacificus TaxID=337701 RepID=A0A1M7JUI6_9RHOB|nr:ABC transporter ATP-binding protein [Roseovarius pacificus]GGO62285.1 ABC transporter ATP-binding protein [Roseovarius pacificus]SHM56648.1 peptide/nickel transport system ATP-binding protein/oligopeptide transport system ATP-binding protein [Roseovarius pacificus]
MTEDTALLDRGPSADAGADPVLQVEDLRTYFDTRDGVVKAVDGLSFSVRPGEILSVVGESGCGKSITSLSVMQLLPRPPARFASGRIMFKGSDLLQASEEEMRRVRGNEISMIFQDPMSSLNPVLSIGDQLTEAIMLHQGLSQKQAMDHAAEMLDLVHIPEPRRRLKEYPHQLSGGMRQRVMIAMALSCNPSVLIADEPTTALDVTIQAQILALMEEIRDKLKTAIILITHDLGVVAEMADRVLVMYAGRKVEEADVAEIFERPQHPYTRGLMRSVPRLTTDFSEARQERLSEIPGIVPALTNLPKGCTFAERCAFATDRCRAEYPALEPKKPDHLAACWESANLPDWTL